MPGRYRLISVLLSVTVLCGAVPLSVSAWRRKAEQVFRWTEQNGHACVTDYIGAQSECEIPSILGGMTVTEIGERAFAENETLRILLLPDTLETVGHYAFYGCPVLQEIRFRSAQETVGAYAFSQCPQVQTVELCAKYIEEGAFSGMAALHTVTLTGTEKIGEAAFADCPVLRDVMLPQTVRSIGREAFFNDPKLLRVTVPANAQIGTHAFGYQCGSDILNSIPVEGFVLHKP